MRRVKPRNRIWYVLITYEYEYVTKSKTRLCKHERCFLSEKAARRHAEGWGKWYSRYKNLMVHIEDFTPACSSKLGETAP